MCALIGKECVYKMPKRKNPFGDAVPIQIKVHVGFKQVASEAEKQEVYARTRSLLFKGANPPAKATNGVNALGSSNGASHSASVEERNGQANGKLSNGSVASCKCCRRKCERGVVCCHCSAVTCGTCSRVCERCTLTFCQFCSVLNYDEKEVRCFCFDCL